MGVMFSDHKSRGWEQQCKGAEMGCMTLWEQQYKAAEMGCMTSWEQQCKAVEMGCMTSWQTCQAAKSATWVHVLKAQ
eukprot:scaffold302052_cov17-Tisochrysis_lutea.AAC.1